MPDGVAAWTRAVKRIDECDVRLEGIDLDWLILDDARWSGRIRGTSQGVRDGLATAHHL